MIKTYHSLNDEQILMQELIPSIYNTLNIYPKDPC